VNLADGIHAREPNPTRLVSQAKSSLFDSILSPEPGTSFQLVAGLLEEGFLTRSGIPYRRPAAGVPAGQVW
jgi:hypothetical protein